MTSEKIRIWFSHAFSSVTSLILPIIGICFITFSVGFSVLSKTTELFASLTLRETVGVLNHELYYTTKGTRSSAMRHSLAYSYEVEKVKFTSDKLNIRSNYYKFARREDISERIERFSGDTIKVYYSSLNPSFSVLEKRLSIWESMGLGISILRNLIFYSLTIYALCIYKVDSDSSEKEAIGCGAILLIVALLSMFSV